MDKKNILLSLCIPTYNRAAKINICLQAIFEAMDKLLENKIEIIISDNNSEDNTRQIVEKFIASGLKLKYFKNETNLGYLKNIVLLLTKYSHGEYIWMIGDDDFIDKNSLKYVIDLLEYKKNVNLFVLKYRLFESNNEYGLFAKADAYKYPDLSSTFIITKLSQALDIVCDGGNILGTFMSSMIFRTKRVNQECLTHITGELSYWDKRFQYQFPLAYILLSSFLNEKEVLCIKDPLISIVRFEKEWDDKLPFLYYKVIPDMYTYFTNLGLEKKHLKKTRKTLFFINFQLLKRKRASKILIFKNMIKYFSPAYFSFIFKWLRSLKY
jgi:glycosyltransferase involved in cell wall biosynthesis